MEAPTPDAEAGEHAASRGEGTATGDRSVGADARKRPTASRGPPGPRATARSNAPVEPIAGSCERQQRFAKIPHPERQRHPARLLRRFGWQTPRRVATKKEWRLVVVSDERAARTSVGGHGDEERRKRVEEINLLRPAEQLPWRRHMCDGDGEAH